MNNFGGSWVILSMCLGLSAAACGGDDDGGGNQRCTTPHVTGQPTLSTGTATVQGSGTLPAGIPDGYELELMVNEGGLSESVFPQGLFEIPTVCGQGFTFKITSLAAGTYKLDYGAYDPKSESLDPALRGTSTNQFTVGEGATVDFNPTF